MPIPAITVPFGPWEPDSADLNSNVLTVALNVFPSKVGYSGVGRFTDAGYSALGGVPRGSAIIDANGIWCLYAGVGTTLKQTKAGITTINTRGSSYTGPSAGQYWRFAKFGTVIFAANKNDPVQQAAFPDGNFSATAAVPDCVGVFTVGDFLFAVQPDGDKRSIAWSDINDYTDWSSGLSDSQEFPDGGDVFGIAGDKSGYVIQRGCIRTFQFLPGDTTTIFEFNKLKVPGAVGSHAWTMAGDTLYYYSEEGFCAIGPDGFRRIGAHRIDSYAIGQLNANAALCIAVSDPYFPRVYFHFESTVLSTLVYDYSLDRWSEYDVAEEGTLVDAIDGHASFSTAQIIINSAGKIGTLAHGTNNAAATLTTSELELWQSGQYAGQRADITAIRPIVDGAVTSVAVTTKDKLNGSATTTSSTTQETNGRFSLMAGGAYHKFSLTTTAANTATYHKGVQVWAMPAGEA